MTAKQLYIQFNTASVRRQNNTCLMDLKRNRSSQLTMGASVCMYEENLVLSQ